MIVRFEIIISAIIIVLMHSIVLFVIWKYKNRSVTFKKNLLKLYTSIKTLLSK